MKGQEFMLYQGVFIQGKNTSTVIISCGCMYVAHFYSSFFFIFLKPLLKRHQEWESMCERDHARLSSVRQNKREVKLYFIIIFQATKEQKKSAACTFLIHRARSFWKVALPGYTWADIFSEETSTKHPPLPLSCGTETDDGVFDCLQSLRCCQLALEKLLKCESRAKLPTWKRFESCVGPCEFVLGYFMSNYIILLVYITLPSL